MVKLFKRVAKLPLPLEYPVKTMDDWLRLKPHYAFSPDRVGENASEVAEKLIDAGQVITVGIPGGFSEPLCGNGRYGALRRL